MYFEAKEITGSWNSLVKCREQIIAEFQNKTWTLNPEHKGFMGEIPANQVAELLTEKISSSTQLFCNSLEIEAFLILEAANHLKLGVDETHLDLFARRGLANCCRCN